MYDPVGSAKFHEIEKEAMPNVEKELCFNHVFSLQLANAVIPFKVTN